MAAGLTVKKENIAMLRRQIQQHASGVLNSENLQPSLTIDAKIQLAELDKEFFEQMRQFEPWGMKNRTPVFMLSKAKKYGASKVVGNQHLKFQVTSEGIVVDAIWFRAGEIHIPSEEIDVVFVPELNEFRGEKSVQLCVKDIQSARER